MTTRKIAIALIALSVVSCGKKQTSGRRNSGMMSKEYPVMEVKLGSTTLFNDYAALLKGQQTVEIRPRIPGYIEQIYVDEGAFVKKGQLLFRLNDNDLQATVRSAEALVKVADAAVYSAQLNLDKTKPLAEKNIVSNFDLETAESSLKASQAQLAQAQANLQNARANLAYAMIISPAEGTIGIFPYRVGSLVNSTMADPLTTISNTEKVFAYFSLNEKDFLFLTKGLKGKNIQEKLSHLPDVQLVLADNSTYKFPGRVETASGLVDPQTGAVTMRATFPNPEGRLLSGGSGMVRIPQQIDSAIIIPQKATYDLQNKHFVYVVGADNKVKNTEIDVYAGNLKNTYVVTSGLKVGDKIVLDGIAALRDGMEIKTKPGDPGNLSENSIESGMTSEGESLKN